MTDRMTKEEWEYEQWKESKKQPIQQRPQPTGTNWGLWLGILGAVMSGLFFLYLMWQIGSM